MNEHGKSARIAVIENDRHGKWKCRKMRRFSEKQFDDFWSVDDGVAAVNGQHSAPDDRGLTVSSKGCRRCYPLKMSKGPILRTLRVPM